MVTTVVIVVDKRADLTFQIAGQEVVFQENPVLHGLVPAIAHASCDEGSGA